MSEKLSAKNHRLALLEAAATASMVSDNFSAAAAVAAVVAAEACAAAAAADAASSDAAAAAAEAVDKAQVEQIDVQTDTAYRLLIFDHAFNAATGALTAATSAVAGDTNFYGMIFHAQVASEVKERVAAAVAKKQRRKVGASKSAIKRKNAASAIGQTCSHRTAMVPAFRATRYHL